MAPEKASEGVKKPPIPLIKRSASKKFTTKSIWYGMVGASFRKNLLAILLASQGALGTAALRQTEWQLIMHVEKNCPRGGVLA